MIEKFQSDKAQKQCMTMLYDAIVSLYNRNVNILQSHLTVLMRDCRTVFLRETQWYCKLCSVAYVLLDSGGQHCCKTPLCHALYHNFYLWAVKGIGKRTRNMININLQSLSQYK